MNPIISVKSLHKEYQGGHKALTDIQLDIQKGEIFALLGPNGAGKTTLISSICGIVNPSSGSVEVGGFDIIKDYRKAREIIGLVPQELATDAFESVWDTVTFSRALFGKPRDSSFIESLLKSLSLWDKKNSKVMTLSGGMKRRLMIAKALSHEPRVLFLDEPSAGVDVELRKAMWQQVRELRESGVTIILTTHYIEEAEEMADRVGVINRGNLILTEEKKSLMQKLGKKTMTIELVNSLEQIPTKLSSIYDLKLAEDKKTLVLNYDIKNKEIALPDFFHTLKEESIEYKDLSTKQSSLEEVFMELVKQ